MPSGRKKSGTRSHEPWTEEEVMEFGLAGEEEQFGMTEITHSDDQHCTSFYGGSVPNGGTNFDAPSVVEITKSGRMRKKTAKLIEMEEVDKLEKIPRKMEPSKLKKSKSPKASSRAAINPSTSTVFDSANLSEDSGDITPLVIANTYSLSSAMKTSPEFHTPASFGMIETPALKPKKTTKAKKTSCTPSDGFAGKFDYMPALGEGEHIQQGNAIFGTVASTTEQTSISLSPKKSSKKKSNVVPPFTIKMETSGEHLIVGNHALQPDYTTSNIPLLLSSTFPGEILPGMHSGLAVKEEADSGNVPDGMVMVRKEKMMKKDKAERRKIDLTGSGDEGKLSEARTSKKKKKLKIGKQLQNTRKEVEKPKKKRQKGYTAYMLWCSVQRAKVVAQNPGIDFAQISKRLGDMWQTVPEKEKMTLRRKARRMAKKGSSLIKTGFSLRDEMSAADASHRKMLHNTKPLKLKLRTIDDPIVKVSSIDHVDVAAHLKLLGESLTTIGARLQEHRGNIAVQGSLSVLLDSLLCTLGPLMCLTNQVPQLNGCPEEIHRSTLENIAYVMPGVG